MSPDSAHRGRLGVFLILGRVSNLPTVWSNCLAAWLLSGQSSRATLAILSLGATLLYTGGMFLNDAFDAAFDRQFRPERPIPSGQIGRRTVWLAGISCLCLGWLALLPLGTRTVAVGAILVSCIVLYDAIHKKTHLAPLLMCGCRLLLYLLAGSAAERGFTSDLLWRALVLAAYVAGISYMAKGESTMAKAPMWSVALLFAPSLLGFCLGDLSRAGIWLVEAILAGWILWWLRNVWVDAKPLSHSVSGLLAGIVVVDWLAVVGQAPNPFVFPALFALTLLVQRVVPAT